MCGKRSLSLQGHVLSDSRRESARGDEDEGVDGKQLILILVKSKCAEAGAKFIGQDQLNSKDRHPTRLDS